VGFLDTRAGESCFRGILLFYKGEELLIYYWETKGATEATKYEGIKERPLWPLRDKIY
jgi:hypothetical protein